ncbi:MAG: GAF domain-containing protein [Pyrinomonadaceae bacterium]
MNIFDSDSPNDVTGRGARYVQHLSEALKSFETASTLSTPLLGPIEKLLRLAMQEAGGAAASVLVRDHDQGGLRFLVALGDVSEKLKSIRIPQGKGIAGLVMMSGQPMALGDAAHEGSFWSEADKKTGFKTVTLMATPLRAGDEIVGVLQFVNRPGAPPYAPFAPDEMDTAAEYAESIGKLVQAYEVATLVESMFEQWVKDAAAAPPGQSTTNSGLRAWLKETPISADYRELVLLGMTVYEIAGLGAAQREMCLEVMEALARFSAKESAGRASYLGF